MQTVPFGRAFLAAVLLFLTCPAVAAAQCNTITDDAERLACWDAAFPPPADAAATEAPPTKQAVPENGSIGPWTIQTEKDALTDARNVYLSTPSLEAVPGRFRDNDYARLIIACRDNTTSFVVFFGGAFMSSSEYDSYGEVRYRVDDRKPGRRTFDESTSHEHLGLWNGGASIPVIKQLFGGKKLVIAATPYSENPIQLEFDITGVDDAIAPVRVACGW